MPVSEVTAPHAPFYTQAPGKNGPTTAPFIYLQQGTGVRPSGKVKDDYSEITLVNQLKGWVSGDLLGSISSER